MSRGHGNRIRTEARCSRGRPIQPRTHIRRDARSSRGQSSHWRTAPCCTPPRCSPQSIGTHQGQRTARVQSSPQGMLRSRSLRRPTLRRTCTRQEQRISRARSSHVDSAPAHVRIGNLGTQLGKRSDCPHTYHALSTPGCQPQRCSQSRRRGEGCAARLGALGCRCGRRLPAKAARTVGWLQKMVGRGSWASTRRQRDGRGLARTQGCVGIPHHGSRPSRFGQPGRPVRGTRTSGEHQGNSSQLVLRRERETRC